MSRPVRSRGRAAPGGTKAVDAAVLLARMLVPEPMRPGWTCAVDGPVGAAP